MAETRHDKRTKEAGGTYSVTGGSEAEAEARQAAADKEKLTSGLSSGKAAKGGGAGMPKQEIGEDAGAYSERVRKWRASKASAATQGKALGGY